MIFEKRLPAWRPFLFGARGAPCIYMCLHGAAYIVPIPHSSRESQSGRILPNFGVGAQETGRNMFSIKINSSNISKKSGINRDL
ncbi:hypothetical protein INH39_05515 [Massilia violaceinigra]|uniref:Uncharacterized protein n=1 Tax=Massilia violaceinigra TaxID=2045208 RepID=A0ABY4A9Y3_9BURK|nr:hypothetical protein [Massilia violaceinigra]UOD31177.1 hypothetical protein INH39_05515 [Massilia violaceinigra]